MQANRHSPPHDDPPMSLVNRKFGRTSEIVTVFDGTVEACRAFITLAWITTNPYCSCCASKRGTPPQPRGFWAFASLRCVSTPQPQLHMARANGNNAAHAQFGWPVVGLRRPAKPAAARHGFGGKPFFGNSLAIYRLDSGMSSVALMNAQSNSGGHQTKGLECRHLRTSVRLGHPADPAQSNGR